MIIGLIVAAFLAAHLIIGWRLALRALPDTWRQAREHWGPGADPDDIRIDVRAETIGMTLFWPLLLTGRTFLGLFDGICDHAEVREFRRQLNNHDRSTP